MTGVLIPLRLRELVVGRDAGRCAFCHCAEELMGVTFEIDHIIPRAAGGSTTLDNLCLCCPTCNRRKAARTRVLDPVSGEGVALFHPVRDAWEGHFEWHDGATLVAGRTAVGRAMVEALQMNRPAMVALRRYWAATGHHPLPARG